MSANNKRIYLSPPHLTGEEQPYIQKAFQENWVAPVGPQIIEFENKLKSYLKVDNVVALNSATSAIHLGLKALGVGAGDYVVCPMFSFVATVNPVKYLGGIPVFVDSEKETWNMCPYLLDKAIKNLVEEKGVKPKVVVITHVYGFPGKVDELLAVAKKYDIKVLEDAAPALGSMYKGVKCGALADIGVVSFNGNKILTTSGGGVLLTQSSKISDKVLSWATQSKSVNGDFVHDEIGYNYRLSNVSAAIGCGQMDVVEDRLLSKEELHKLYKLNLKECELDFHDVKGGNYWLSPVLFKDHTVKEAVKTTLLANEIEVRDLWCPLHLQKPYSKELFYVNGVSDDLYRRGLVLPSGTAQTDEETNRVVSIIKECLGGHQSIQKNINLKQ